MSDAAYHCPHCGGELPSPETEDGSPVSFCPSCGRRIEGWKTGFRATVGGAGADEAPGLEEPTQAIAPSASLLRQAVATQVADAHEAQATQLDMPVVAGATGPTKGAKKKSSALAPLFMIVGAAALAIVPLVLLQKPHVEPTPAPAPVIVAAIPDVPAPVQAPPLVVPEPVAKSVAKTPEPVAPVAKAPEKKAPEPKPAAKPEPKVAKAPVVVPPTRLIALQPKAGPSTKGNLPHKATSKTDSKVIDASTQPSGTGQGAATTSAPPALVPEPSAPTSEASAADADNVRFVVQSHLAQVQACYSRAFKDTAPGGRVDVAFLIGGNGKATHVRTEANGTHSQVLSGCLEQRIAEWQFVRPASGQFELIYPFVFSPGS